MMRKLRFLLRLLTGVVLILGIVLHAPGLVDSQSMDWVRIWLGISFFILCSLYALWDGSWWYALAFLLFGAGGLSEVLMVLNWSGAEFFRSSGTLSYGLIALILIVVGIRFSDRTGSSLMYLLAAFLLIRSATAISEDLDVVSIGKMANYFLVGIIGTIKLQQIPINGKVSGLLEVVLLNGLLYLIGQVFRVLV